MHVMSFDQEQGDVPFSSDRGQAVNRQVTSATAACPFALDWALDVQLLFVSLLTVVHGDGPACHGAMQEIQHAQQRGLRPPAAACFHITALRLIARVAWVRAAQEQSWWVVGGTLTSENTGSMHACT